MTMPSTMRAPGAPLNRLDGVQKVTGAAKYSYEYPVAGVTYIVPVQSTIARGRVSSIDASAARALPGVLAVLSHENAPRLAPPRDDQDLAVFQSDAVAYRGQFVAAIVAETLETARQAASMVAVRYEEQPHDVVLRADRGDLFTPEYVPQKPFGFYPADSAHGDVEAALAAAPVSLDHTYTTPAEHHNPMEPHTTLAIWSDDGTGESVTVYDTCQGVSWRRDDIAIAFGLSSERVRVIAPYVGGGFGSRGFTHPYAILAVMAAPVVGLPDSSRGLVACLREGAERFGWAPGDPTPRTRRAGRWLIGTGVAASTYPAVQLPASARVAVDAAGRYRVSIAAVDIGTGAWTVLFQIAADALAVPVEQVQLEIGDSTLPQAFPAWGSTGTASWGWAITDAAQKLRARMRDEHGGTIPPEGLEADGGFAGNPAAQQFSMHAFGAQFAEVRVNEDRGEVRVPRLPGVFAAGRIVNPKTARSQVLGGMTWGLSMALHEESVLDPRFGDYVNHDFAEYHIATNADVGEIDVSWIDEEDPHVNPIGVKGIGEIGIVGTGIRVRDLPITLDKLLP